MSAAASRTAYRIRDFNEAFESAESRKVKYPEWGPRPVDLNSRGRVRLIRLGEPGYVALAVWDGIVQVAQSQPPERRGQLVNRDGSPMNDEDISIATRFPDDVVSASLSLLQDVGWLTVQDDDRATTGEQPGDDRATTGQPPASAPTREERRESNTEGNTSCSPSKPAAPDVDPGPDGAGPDRIRPDAEPAAPSVAACPYDAIATAYHETLVPPLPALRNGIPKSVRPTVRARWRDELAAADGDAIQAMSAFVAQFERCRGSPFLMGRKTDWQCPGLSWLVKAANWEKLANGEYDDRETTTAPRGGTPSRYDRLRESGAWLEEQMNGTGTANGRVGSSEAPIGLHDTAPRLGQP